MGDDHKVVTLRGGPVAVAMGSISEDLIAHLEDILTRARSGEYSGMAVALIDDQYNCSFRTVGGLSYCYSMVGALDTLKHAIVSNMLEESTPRED